METDALRWFQRVADGATVTEIAEQEILTQPSVSRALARLEAEAGTPLLRRSGRHLVLTNAGAAFKRHVDAVIHHLDDGIAAVQQQIDPETGTVTVAFQPSLGTWLIPDLIGSFRQQHPGIAFDLHAKLDEHAAAVGPRSAVDVELSTLRSGGEGREWRTLLNEPLRLLLPRGHRLAGRHEASLSEVGDDPFVTLRESSLLRSQLERLCAEAAIDLRVAFVADDLPTLRGYVASGLGVAILPARWVAGAAEPSSPWVHYLELTDPGARRDVGLSWYRERRLLPAAELFREYVLRRAAAGELPVPAPVSQRPGSPSRVTRPER